MIAQAENLMNFLKGPKQFILSIYQSTCSWTLKECGRITISNFSTACRALLIDEAFLLMGFKESKWKN